jgi:hypothetical protein
MQTPWFPEWRRRLAALGRRSVRSLRQLTLHQLDQHLAGLLPAHLLSQADEGPFSRARIYTLRLTLECFLWQMLTPNTACREVVRQVQALFGLHDQGPVDEATSAYIQARQKLSEERLRELLSATAQAAQQRIPASACLQGRPVKVVDGSSTVLPDTAANQKDYPQPKRQKPGCGFPVMKFLVLFCLRSGALLHVIMDSLHNHDLRLFHRVWEELKKDDIVLGDRAFGDYATMALLPRRGVDVVARVHQTRRVDFRRAQRLGKNDGLCVWQKSPAPSKHLPTEEWQAMPETITVRIIRFTATIRGFRSRRITLVTTLLDPLRYPAQEIIDLYARRWRLELTLRDLKTTMGMEQLRGQSPAMARKELLAYLIAHNLIRCVMAEAVAQHEVALERVSFKGTVDALRQYSVTLGQARSAKKRQQLWEALLLNLARDLVPYRPHRREPRAVKLRPKQYPLLNKPRHQFREIPHRTRYWNKKPRNYRGLN